MQLLNFQQKRSDYYEMYAEVPVLTYDEQYYAGESYNPNKTDVHRLLEKYTQYGLSFFHYKSLVLPTLIVILSEFKFDQKTK